MQSEEQGRWKKEEGIRTEDKTQTIYDDETYYSILGSHCTGADRLSGTNEDAGGQLQLQDQRYRRDR